MNFIMENYFSRGFTSFSEEEKAIEDISHQILKENTQFSLLFFSDKYDAKKLEVYIKKYFGDNVLACSSAGEIAADGYHDNGITGLAFHGEAFRINSFL
ncbi:MAG: hypothetical protein KDD50_03140, partial [Bdellovibrionales bacterium]|nr:hypothetical protein [Bdellovibrionales bacterium]